MKKAILLEHHPSDSRLKILKDGICQTLRGRMGTGGGNVPLVLICLESTNENATITDGSVSPTLKARGGTGGGNVPIMVLLEGMPDGICNGNRTSSCGDNEGGVSNIELCKRTADINE